MVKIEDTVCVSRNHCTTCRDKDGGRKWREQLLNGPYQVPNSEIDFICSFGVEWNSKDQKNLNIQPMTPCCGENNQSPPSPPQPQSVDLSLVEQRKQICLQCDVYQTKYGLSYCGNFLIDAVKKIVKETLTDEKAMSCGCVLDIKWRMKNQKCPQGKW